MNTSEFDQEFVEELERRIEIINDSDTPEKRLKGIDYVLIWIFGIFSIVLLFLGWQI
ncbi:hypothetical protein [Bacillus norwichensis]|uniref:YqzM family protein n=1 Tax=Bacillus norwichensis TaxID=2762217 RepID=A0ABR8VLY6_9BACI|nr:hypothetical protein [Bacillus norwichensis]MBD8005792.1 hypothetical protein [Bacillus norwichensis]